MKGVFKVSFVSESNCFFYLNKKNLAKYEKDGELDGNCIKIEFGANFENCFYSSLSSRPIEIDDGRVGLNYLNSKYIGIKENDEILISVANAPLLAEVHCRPQTDKHYQLLVNNNSFLETDLLNQVKAVTLGKIIPVHVFSNIVVNLRLEKFTPETPFGLLQRCTNIVIREPSEMAEFGSSFGQNGDGDKLQSSKQKTPITRFFSGIFQKYDKCSRKTDETCRKSNQNRLNNELEKYLSQFCVKKKFPNFRIVPIFFAPKEIQEITDQNEFFACGLPVPITVDGPCCFKILCKIRTDNFGNTNYFDVSSTKSDSCQMFSYVISLSVPTHQFSDILYASDSTMEMLNVEHGSRVYVEQVNAKKHLEEVNRQVIPFQNSYWRGTDYFFPKNMKKIYDSVTRVVVDNIRHGQKINSLIIGSVGSGKTKLVTSMMDYFRNKRLQCAGIECKTMRKLKMSTLKKSLRDNLNEYCGIKPSVIILEDLDSLMFDEEGENSYSSIYSARIGNLIINLVNSYQSMYDIFFIATGSSLAKFKDISTDRGSIIFENIHEIGELTLSERAFMVECLSKTLIKTMSVENHLFESVASRTKGYNIQDLVDLLQIANFSALSRENPNGEIIDKDFDYALSEKVPLSMHGIKLQKKSLTKWEDIGGMEEVKNILKEMFYWPVRYQELYKSCPLRLQCGVLLYGAPGTGKTLIASAVANEFGLNFISIKGPEIFSKYVGGSEEGVRDLFVRAKSAKPCLLFFDEFDSMGRRRGSSNEEVNDRVVNQLLTELDGVEELSGVFILAATSRPELLDPALLRPGRIDRVVHCKMPTEAERLSVLKVLSKNVKLSDDVRLEDISAKTDGYSGADLRAILYTAQSTLIKEIRQYGNSHEELALKQSHLLAGLSETKPSISKVDRENYSSRYEEFIATRSGQSNRRNRNIQQIVMYA